MQYNHSFTLLRFVTYINKYKHLTIHQKINYKSFYRINKGKPFVNFNVYNHSYPAHFFR